jgi:hypothetical protein
MVLNTWNDLPAPSGHAIIIPSNWTYIGFSEKRQQPEGLNK